MPGYAHPLRTKLMADGFGLLHILALYPSADFFFDGQCVAVHLLGLRDIPACLVQRGKIAEVHGDVVMLRTIHTVQDSQGTVIQRLGFRVRRSLHLQPGGHRTSGWRCHARRTTAVRPLSPSVAGGARLGTPRTPHNPRNKKL
jgi:hypothetical protein